MISEEPDMGDAIGRGTRCALLLVCAALIGIASRPVAAQPVESSGLKFPSDEACLRFLAPGNDAYRTLDGNRMKRGAAIEIPLFPNSFAETVEVVSEVATPERPSATKGRSFFIGTFQAVEGRTGVP